MAKGGHWASLNKDGKWQHTKQDDGVVAIYDTQAEAWEAAKVAARADESEAFLKDTDGKIRERNTYGYDPVRYPG